MNNTKKFIFLIVIFALFTVNMTVFKAEAQEEIINTKPTTEELKVLESVDSVDPQKPTRSRISRRRGKLTNEERALKKRI